MCDAWYMMCDVWYDVISGDFTWYELIRYMTYDVQYMIYCYCPPPQNIFFKQKARMYDVLCMMKDAWCMMYMMMYDAWGMMMYDDVRYKA